MRLANVFRLGIKELRGLLRDRMLLVLVVYSFTFSIYTAAKSMPDTVHHGELSIVDEDRSPLSERVIQGFYPPYFSTPPLISQGEMDRRMNAGIDTFALDIPPHFERDVLAGRTPTVQLNVDATRMSQAFTGSGYITAIVSGEVDELVHRRRTVTTVPVDLELRARFNPSLESSWFGAISNLVTSITMLAIVLTGAALIREREHGTIEHLLVMPVRTSEIMVAKVWSMSLVVFVATFGALMIVVRGLLGVPIEGSIALFMVGVALHLFATTCLGILLATIAGSMPQFGLLLMLVLLPLQVLSGEMTPRESMPVVVRDIMLAAPNTHFVMLSQAVLFRGAGLETVWPQLLALAGLGAGFFAIAFRRFRAFLR